MHCTPLIRVRRWRNVWCRPKLVIWLEHYFAVGKEPRNINERMSSTYFVIFKSRKKKATIWTTFNIETFGLLYILCYNLEWRNYCSSHRTYRVHHARRAYQQNDLQEIKFFRLFGLTKVHFCAHTPKCACGLHHQGHNRPDDGGSK
jgi:hypothetical protein